MLTEEIVKIKLPKPHSGQREVLNAFKKKRFITLNCGRRWGKSLISRQIAIFSAFNEESVAYVTPTFALGKKFFNEILKALPEVIIKTSNKSDLIIELVNGGTITFLSGERLDSFRGSAFHVIIIDEASYIPNLEEAWLNSISPTLTDYQGKCLFISTPRGKDYFFQLCQKNDDEWINFHFTTYDNPHISKAEIDRFKSELPSSAFNQEFLAIAGENQNAIVSLSVIERNTIDSLSNNETVVLGIDLAKKNDFTSVIGLDAFGNQSYFDSFQLDYTSTINKLMELPQNITKVIDATGVGMAVYDVLSLSQPNLIPFTFTATSKPLVIKKLIMALETDKVKYIKEVADEIGTYEYKLNASGNISYNAISGCHDDNIISLALAFNYLPNVTINENWINRFSF